MTLLVRFVGDTPESEPVETGRGSRWWPGEMRVVDDAIGLALVAAHEGWEACRESDTSGALTADEAKALRALVSGAGMRFNDTSAAGSNAAIINTALAAGDTVNLIGSGVCWINDCLLIGSRTKLFLEAGLTLKMADGVAKTMLETTSHASGVDRAVTSITSVGTVATVTITNHGRAVNDWVSLSGSTSQFYNGTFQVESTPARRGVRGALRADDGATPSTSAGRNRPRHALDAPKLVSPRSSRGGASTSDDRAAGAVRPKVEDAAATTLGSPRRGSGDAPGRSPDGDGRETTGC